MRRWELWRTSHRQTKKKESQKKIKATWKREQANKNGPNYILVDRNVSTFTIVLFVGKKGKMWRWCFKKSNVAGLTKNKEDFYGWEIRGPRFLGPKKERKKEKLWLPSCPQRNGETLQQTPPARRTNEKIKKNETRITERKGLVICFGVQSHKRGGDR